jgi:hypothetical protein
VRKAFARETLRTPSSLLRSKSLAVVSIQAETSASAGPPLGRLYLKPPLFGGSCDGVMTMPSPRPLVRSWLYTMSVCAIAGVGVDAEKQRAVDALAFAIAADALADRECRGASGTRNIPVAPALGLLAKLQREWLRERRHEHAAHCSTSDRTARSIVMPLIKVLFAPCRSTIPV